MMNRKSMLKVMWVAMLCLLTLECIMGGIYLLCKGDIVFGVIFVMEGLIGLAGVLWVLNNRRLDKKKMKYFTACANRLRTD